jgi:large subunit ribosomal protein L18
MKRTNTYTIQFRRKREGATNYRKRMKMLSSNCPRLVVRRSLKNIQASITEYNEKGDIMMAYSHSEDLKRFGWVYGTGNLPASYLVGFLLGKRARVVKLDKVALDIGQNKSISGSRIYAVLAGALDAGMKIPHGEGILPSKDRINGSHIEKYGELLKGQSLPGPQFSTFIKKNLHLKGIVKNFEDTKKNIENNPVKNDKEPRERKKV